MTTTIYQNNPNSKDIAFDALVRESLNLENLRMSPPGPLQFQQDLVRMREELSQKREVAIDEAKQIIKSFFEEDFETAQRLWVEAQNQEKRYPELVLADMITTHKASKIIPQRRGFKG